MNDYPKDFPTELYDEIKPMIRRLYHGDDCENCYPIIVNIIRTVLNYKLDKKDMNDE